MRRAEVQPTITDHDRLLRQPIFGYQAADLISLRHTDVAPTDEGKELIELEHRNDALREIPSLGCADRQGESGGVQAKECFRNPRIKDVLGVADLRVALAIGLNKSIDQVRRIRTYDVLKAAV